MSEDKEQAVAEEVNEQSQETVSETDGAQEQKSDDLESLLNEFNAETGASQPEQKTETKTDQVDSDTVQRAADQAYVRLKAEQDEETLFKAVRGDLPEDLVGDEWVKGFVLEKINKRPELMQAWIDRAMKPQQYQKIVNALANEFSKPFAKQIDEDATADHEAVAAAVRGTGNKAPEEKAPEYGSMTDAEMRETVRKQHGYTPSI